MKVPLGNGRCNAHMIDPCKSRDTKSRDSRTWGADGDRDGDEDGEGEWGWQWEGAGM